MDSRRLVPRTDLLLADPRLAAAEGRLGRALVSVLLLAVVLPLVDVDWTAARVYLLLVTPLVGCAIYGAMFAVAGGVQFWLVDGAEFTSSFVYGGSYAGQVPGSVLPT